MAKSSGFENSKGLMESIAGFAAEEDEEAPGESGAAPLTYSVEKMYITKVKMLFCFFLTLKMLEGYSAMLCLPVGS